MPDAPAATSVLSTTSTSSPCSARCQAVDRPWTPAPITRCFTERIGSVQRRFPALEHGRPPITPNNPRTLNPRTQRRLWELGVLVLEADAVGVAGLEVGDEHLARDLVLASLGDREVDLEERVRVAVEDGGHPFLYEQLHILQPIEVRAGRGGHQIDAFELADVFLVGKTPAGELLGVDDLAHRAGSRSGRWSIGFSR